MYESYINIGKTDPWARVKASVGVNRGPLSIELYDVNIFNDKNWDFASRVPILSTNAALLTNHGQYMGVLVQAPEVIPARSYLVFLDWDRADLTDRYARSSPAPPRRRPMCRPPVSR